MFEFLLYLAPLILSGLALYKANQAANRLDHHKKFLFKLDDRLAQLEQDASKQSLPEQTSEELVQDNQWQEQETEHPPTARPKSQIETPTIQPLKTPESQIKTRTKGSFEKQVGAKWSVWIGGIALALGAIFLVRHSIIEGYLTPSVRILLSTLFSLALLATGELLRRKAFEIKIDTLPTANIPSIITAAGITGLFATCYAAYALYNMLDPLVAFVLLGAVSIASLLAATIHGPMLATAGLIGAYATPALVASDHPAAWPLFIYLLFVTAAITITCYVRKWPWLTFAGLICATAWGLIWYASAWQPNDTIAMTTFALGLLTIAFFGLKQEEPKPNEDTLPLPASNQIDTLASPALALVSILIFVLLRMDSYSTLSTLILTLITSGFLYIAWRWPSMILTAPLAAILFGLAYLTWHIPSFNPFEVLSSPPRDPLSSPIAPPNLSKFLMIGTGFCLLFAGTGFINLLKSRGHVIWALITTMPPLAIFTYTYLRATAFEQNIPFALIGLILAGSASLATEYFCRTKQAKQWDMVTAIFAITAIAFLSLSLTMALNKGWLTNALALTTLGLAWVSTKRSIPVLQTIAIILTGIVGARLLLDPRIIGDALGTTPIFNWLLYGYGLPAACFGLASVYFKKSNADQAVPILQTAAILFTTVLINLEIRHWLHDGNIYATKMNLLELSLHTATWLGLSIGLQKGLQSRSSSTIDAAILILRLISLVAILCGLLIIHNPLITNESIGTGLIFNDLLIAYALPALLAAIIYYITPAGHKNLYATIAGITALVLLFAYVTLEVRALFHAPFLGVSSFSNQESYSYSLAWLGLGLILLGAGTQLNNKNLRYACLPLLVLVVFKVFIYDTAHLSSLWRALSFIGLGIALLGIGYLYQKVIIPTDTERERSSSSDG